MPPNTVELLREAMTAVRANDRPRTRRLLAEVTQLDPRNETAWQWLAGVAETPAQAVEALERVLALNPGNERARAAVGPARLQAGIAAAKACDGAAARRYLRAVVATDPRNEHAWVWLASAAESPAEALAHLNRVLEIDPQNAAAQKGVRFYTAELASHAQTDAVSTTPTPLAGPTTVRKVVSAAAPPPAEPPPPPRPRTVLVVDDSRTIRKLVSVTMAGAGFRVVEAEDGMDAVARLRESLPDLILLDVSMPGMDGYELCRLVRSTPETKAVPVIMLTGRDGFFDKIRGRVAGTNAYLPKPLQPADLLKAVAKHCPRAAG